MRMSISIMAHPSRAEFFPYLRERLGDVPFAIDDGGGLIPTCRRAWALYDPTADYHLVLQEDAIICDNFLEKALNVLAICEGRAVSFFHICPFRYQKNREQIAAIGGLIDTRLRGGVAICLPTALIPAFLSHFDSDTVPLDDHRIGRFLYSVGLEIFFPIPSLIDHRTDTMSVMWKKPSKNVADEFIDKK